MCFLKKPEHKTVLQAKYDEQNGTVNETNTSSDIPVDIPEHVDNPFLDTDIEEGILGFIYETKDETVTVWTSEEACALGAETTCAINAEID